MPIRETHKNDWKCTPPKGVELLVVRGTGNKWFAEDFLDQVAYFAAGSPMSADACPESSTWRWTEARTTVFVDPPVAAPRPLFGLPTTPRDERRRVPPSARVEEISPQASARPTPSF